MRILESRTYVGPNLYAHFPVIRLTLDLGRLEEFPSGSIPGFVERLVKALPGLAEHGCSYGVPGGFLRRLIEDEGTWMGHILEHVAIELQNLAGIRVTFGKTRGTGQHGQYYVVYEHEEEWVGKQAGRLALDLLHSLLPPELREDADLPPDFDFGAGLEALIRGAQKRAFGPSTAALVRAAEERDIPWIRLSEASLVQFGHSHRQKRIQATVTSETRYIAVEIASDKELTNQILNDIGLPVPRQVSCWDEEDALEAAESVGFPVVVKPLDANHGRGVSINLATPEQVKAAFLQAKDHSNCVLVERFIPGFDHRLLVVDGELVAASKRVPGHVVGDGVSTVAQLVEEVNRDPRRGIGHEKVLTRLEIDHQAHRLLAQAGHTLETVLPAGEVFYLRSTGNLSTGGTAIDVTDDVHPDNREMAVRAAAAIGLDVCGVDFLTPDISRSYRDIGGAICEVNAAPGFRMHTAPSEGHPRDVAGAVMDMLFPPGTPSRIPIAAITGTNGKTTTTRMLAHIHKQNGAVVGMTTTDGVYIDGQRTVEGDMTGPVSAKMVLRHPSVTVAVLETARGGLLRAGMGYRKPNVSCCLNVTADHLGMGGINTVEQLAEVKRIPIEVAQDAAVLNADDPLCVAMAGHTEAKHIYYATMRSDNALVREHIRAGGRAVALEAGVNGEMITMYDRGQPVPLLWTHLIPATLEGQARHNVQNAMFAAAMAHAMGVKLDTIRHGLRTFDTTFFQTPGRMNVFDQNGYRVILDYGHNPAAVTAMCDLVDAMSATAFAGRGRRICVLGAPGDRRDEDIAAIAARAARSFDLFLCRPDDDRRGRAPMEIPERLRDALVAAGVPESAIELADSEVASVERALAMAQPGDLVLIFGDKINRTWKQVIYSRTPARAAAAAAAPPPIQVDEGALQRDARGVWAPIHRED